MSAKSRVVLIALVVLVALASTADSEAICGYPGFVSASAFNGGVGYVVLFNPATFATTGIAQWSLNGSFGDNAYKTALAAVSATPPKFMFIAMPGANPCCYSCCAAPGAGLCGPGVVVWVGIYS